MPELRKDPILDRWVIMAPQRAERPEAFSPLMPRQPSGACPFCEGREHETPPEVLCYREPGSQHDGPGWRLRVVPNKFPALEMGEDQCRLSLHETAPLSRSDRRPYEAMPGVGVHEVFIESPRHIVRTAELSSEQLADVFLAYRERMAAARRDRRLRYGTLFKNVGAAAGASLEHVHSQLIATPIVPVVVREEMTGSLDFFQGRGRCIYCHIVEQERAAGVRVVQETAGFLAFCPFAARLPYETWIVPKTHASHYETVPRAALVDLAGVVRQTLAKIEALIDPPAYNYFIHTAPFDSGDVEHYHWHIEVVPTLTRTAGFELASGYYINPVPPEQAAAVLRHGEQV